MVVALVGLLLGSDVRADRVARLSAVHFPLPLTAENAARITEGMALHQVREILGPATRTDGPVARWSNERLTVLVVVKGDRVVFVKVMYPDPNPEKQRRLL